MTNKYLNKKSLDKAYLKTQNLIDKTSILLGAGGLGYSALNLAQDGESWKYLAGLGAMAGSYGANIIASKINKNREQRELKELEKYVKNVPIQVDNLEEVKTKHGVRLETSLN